MGVLTLMIMPVYFSEAKIVKKAPQTQKKNASLSEEKQTVKISGMNFEDLSIREFSFRKERLRNKNGAPQIISKKGDCILTWLGGNWPSFNPHFELTCGGKNYAVVDIKMYSVSSLPRIVGGKRFCTKASPPQTFYDSYIPYSRQLHQPELVESGLLYLKSLVAEARQSLTSIRSRAFPRTAINDISRSEFPLMLLLNEHMDEAAFVQSVRKGTFNQLVEKLLAEFGLNRDRAKKFSVSRDQACCLAQFICDTYARVVRSYPEANLIPDFAQGMRNHLNAAKAMLVLFDADIWTEWRPHIKEGCSRSEESLENCIAVSYNAGPHRLNRVISYWGTEWEKAGSYLNPGVALDQGIQLRPQTKIYLDKLRKLREYFESSRLTHLIPTRWFFNCEIRGIVPYSPGVSMELLFVTPRFALRQTGKTRVSSLGSPANSCEQSKQKICAIP